MVAQVGRPDRATGDDPATSSRRRPEWLDAATALGAVAAMGCVLWRVGDGFDLTDEASYVQAADPPQPGDAFNGFFGLYLRPLWQLTHWDVAAMRVVGLAALVGAAGLLGWSTARLAGRPAWSPVAVTVAATTGYYGAGLRTPSYNWLALLGAVLVSAALLRLLAGGPLRWGALAGAGVAVAATGKITTAGVLAVSTIAVAVLGRRPKALVAAAGALAVALLVHVVAVLPVGESLRTMQRSAAVLASFDPEHYTALGSLRALAAQVPAPALVALLGGLLGLLPAAVAPPPPRREAWFARHCVVTVAVVTVVVLVSRVWSGGFDNGVDLGAGVLPLLSAIGGAVLAGRALHLDGRSGPVALGVAVLGVAAMACAIGSNVSLGWVIGTSGTVLLAPACLLACQALPGRAAPAATVAVLVAVAVGAAVVAVEAHGDLKRTAPLASGTVPVGLGPVTVRVDQESATALRSLVGAAQAAGWRRGTLLVDTTYTPAVPLALGAVVPPVLLPGFPGLSPSSVCAAVRDQGGRWRGAWLLVPRNSTPEDLGRAAACLGRRSPRDYDVVASFTTPWINLPTVLLRPR